MKTLLLVLFSSLFLPFFGHAQCNGHPQLCDKQYDKVAYVTTHNAYNADEDGFLLPNQTFGITRQLEDGVRGLMLDVYDEGGVATAYHGFAILGTATLQSNLTEIKDFLDDNPSEVVTIIFESYINSALMESEFAAVGLMPYLHEQTLGQPWPTLQQMIDNGKRLVVLSDENDATATQQWYHYVWDFAVETGFSANAPSELNCAFNRGDSINDLFILNHFVTDVNLGTGQTDQAAIINAYDFFYPLAAQCWSGKQKFPNFLTVDFHELGDVFEVADSINQIPSTVGISDVDEKNNLVIHSQGSGLYRIRMKGSVSGFLQIWNTAGQLIEQRTIGSQQEFTVDLRNYPTGIYLIRITERDPGKSHSVRLVR